MSPNHGPPRIALKVNHPRVNKPNLTNADIGSGMRRLRPRMSPRVSAPAHVAVSQVHASRPSVCDLERPAAADLHAVSTGAQGNPARLQWSLVLWTGLGGRRAVRCALSAIQRAQGSTSTPSFAHCRHCGRNLKVPDASIHPRNCLSCPGNLEPGMHPWWAPRVGPMTASLCLPVPP